MVLLKKNSAEMAMGYIDQHSINDPTTLTISTAAQLTSQPGKHLNFFDINRMIYVSFIIINILKSDKIMKAL